MLTALLDTFGCTPHRSLDMKGCLEELLPHQSQWNTLSKIPTLDSLRENCKGSPCDAEPSQKDLPRSWSVWNMRFLRWYMSAPCLLSCPQCGVSWACSGHHMLNLDKSRSPERFHAELHFSFCVHDCIASNKDEKQRPDTMFQGFAKLWCKHFTNQF